MAKGKTGLKTEMRKVQVVVWMRVASMGQRQKVYE